MRIKPRPRCAARRQAPPPHVPPHRSLRLERRHRRPGGCQKGPGPRGEGGAEEDEGGGRGGGDGSGGEERRKRRPRRRLGDRRRRLSSAAAAASQKRKRRWRNRAPAPLATQAPSSPPSSVGDARRDRAGVRRRAAMRGVRGDGGTVVVRAERALWEQRRRRGRSRGGEEEGAEAAATETAATDGALTPPAAKRAKGMSSASSPPSWTLLSPGSAAAAAPGATPGVPSRPNELDLISLHRSWCPFVDDPRKEKEGGQRKQRRRVGWRWTLAALVPAAAGDDEAGEGDARLLQFDDGDDDQGEAKGEEGKKARAGAGGDAASPVNKSSPSSSERATDRLRAVLARAGLVSPAAATAAAAAPPPQSLVN